MVELYANKSTVLFNSENITALLLSFYALLIPIAFSHLTSFPNQLIVGTLVNALLAFSALHLSFKKTIPIILLPSIGALASGLIFGKLSIYLLYLIPFIWISNAIFVYLIKYFTTNQYKKLFYIPISSAIKALIIFIPTIILISLNILPFIFIIPMGLIQLITAFCGGILGTLGE